MTLVYILTSISVFGQSPNQGALLEEIDKEITRFPIYVAQHEDLIMRARKRFNAAEGPSVKYEDALQLYELYKAFVSDSAIHFLAEAIKYADLANTPSEAVRCRCLMAIRCTNVGMYDEAQITLDSINIEGLDKTVLGEYYKARTIVYNELAYYTQLENMRQHYWQLANKYEALMHENCPPPGSGMFAASGVGKAKCR